MLILATRLARVSGDQDTVIQSQFPPLFCRASRSPWANRGVIAGPRRDRQPPYQSIVAVRELPDLVLDATAISQVDVGASFAAPLFALGRPPLLDDRAPGFRVSAAMVGAGIVLVNFRR